MSNPLANPLAEAHHALYLNLQRMGGIMPDIFVEKQSEGNWHAIRNGKKVARGTTQYECGCNAKEKYPNDPLLTGRVEHAKRGNPDHWRRLYPNC